MRSRRFGDEALLLECGDADGVRAAHAEALRRRDDGLLRCTDVIPGATTLLLDGLVDLVSVRDGLGEWSGQVPDQQDPGAGRAAGHL